MAKAKATMEPAMIYQQGEDKQRIVITGNQSPVITAMITWTLNMFKRKFDLAINGNVNGSQAIKDSDAPMIVIQDDRRPYSLLTGYHHHIGVISNLDPGDEIEKNISHFADATPKAGILLYSDNGEAELIGKKARTDVTSTPYGLYSSKEENGKLFLVTSTDERIPILIHGEDNLRSISAAKEILKKTGITSGQFYTAMTSFRV
jgi:UDP-N-acetylmuramate: L-alanyl-gamma-D-glutamyl-meso-diaminopimelate ligase